MIKPLDALVFSLYSNKGAYALLLGSGVSRSAEIPTGWEVTTDLIRKLAATRGEDPEPEPEEWFAQAVGEDLSYSALLRGLAWSTAERQQLLRAYFEPTDEERQEGLKQPTAGHRAIARLVADGYVRVILTTNFDRLVERALEEAGLSPTVVSTGAQAQGAIPVVHQQCLVVKLHGDYLGPQLKNTEEELAKYHPRMRQLLSRVLDEFGLVVCGWSADWDTALREAIEKIKGHRFATYWTKRGNLTPAAESLVQLRQAQIVDIADADTFFDTLAERLQSLAEYDRPHPLSITMAVGALKRYLTSDEHQIRLHELISEETEQVYRLIADEERFPVTGRCNAASFGRRLEQYDSLLGKLTSLLATGAYWGNTRQLLIWTKCLERIANCPQGRSAGISTWLDLSYYPALRLLYAAGVAALAAGKYETFYALLNQPQVRTDMRSVKPLTSRVNIIQVIDMGAYRAWIGKKLFTPGSEHLFQVLRDEIRPLVPDTEEYAELFDRFEFVLAANYVHTTSEREGWAPIGRFAYRMRRLQAGGIEALQAGVARDGESHPLLRAGFFDGQPDKFLEAQQPALRIASSKEFY